MPVNVTSDGWSARNDSEYIIDPAKWKSKPNWLEEVDGYRNRATPTDDQTTRFYRCPWTQHARAREWLLGYSTTLIIPGVGVAPPTYQLSRTIPAQDPERPWLFCQEAELVRGEGAWVEGQDVLVLDANGIDLQDPDVDIVVGGIVPWRTRAIAYVSNDRDGTSGKLIGGQFVAKFTTPPTLAFSDGRALLRTVYKPVNYSVMSDAALKAAGGSELRRWVERPNDYGLEALPMARLAQAGVILKFAEGPYKGQPIPEAGVQQLPNATLNYIWNEVPDPPYAAFATALGHVNQDIFDGFGGAPPYPRQTLLCQPWKLDRKTGPTGRIVWRINYRLSFRPQGWNLYPAGDGKFYLATWGGDPAGDRVYKPADFNALFVPPSPIRYLS